MERVITDNKFKESKLPLLYGFFYAQYKQNRVRSLEHFKTIFCAYNAGKFIDMCGVKVMFTMTLN